MNGTAPAPVTCGRIPFHFSIALRFASIFLSSIRSGEIFIFCNRNASASAVAAAMVCSASTLILSRSRFAFSAFCSAVCFASMASVNIFEKLKETIENASTEIWDSNSRCSEGFLHLRTYRRSFGNQFFGRIAG